MTDENKQEQEEYEEVSGTEIEETPMKGENEIMPDVEKMDLTNLEAIKELPVNVKIKLLDFLVAKQNQALSAEKQEKDWWGEYSEKAIARAEQLPPNWDWQYWLILGGRGSGKTRSGAEWIRLRARMGFRYISLIGRSAEDIREVMVVGKSGILNVCSKHDTDLRDGSKMGLPTYIKNQGVILWHDEEGNIKSKARMFSSSEPEKMRGPESDTQWWDEIMTLEHLEDCWSNSRFNFRVPPDPRCLVTGTPRSNPFLNSLMAKPNCAVTVMDSYRNIDNLDSSFRDLLKSYEGTSLGQQEIYAQILSENKDALWRRSTIDENRISKEDFKKVTLSKICIGVDPQTEYSDGFEGSVYMAETGITVVGEGSGEFAGHYYIIDDLSGNYQPSKWAKICADAYREHEASCIIAESNQGGKMVLEMFYHQDKTLNVQLTRASRAKESRANATSLLYEQNKVHHVGILKHLEEQMVTWVVGSKTSPDRIDSLVWGMHYLTANKRSGGVIVTPKNLFFNTPKLGGGPQLLTF